MENTDSPVPLKIAFKDDVDSSSGHSNKANYAMEVTTQPSAVRPKPEFSFIADPKIRKQKGNLLQKKLHKMLEEFLVKTGQQAILLVVAPEPKNASCTIFGSKPLKDIVKEMEPMLMVNLQEALAKSPQSPGSENPDLFVLPPLVCDGIPTLLEKMTQAQLRTFIPQMLKYSTGRKKLCWGKESTRPPWWPEDYSWASVQCDFRSAAQKQSDSWTNFLRSLIQKCYTYHGRQDLLTVFNDEHKNEEAIAYADCITQSTSAVFHTFASFHDYVNHSLEDSYPLVTLPADVGNIKQDLIHFMAEQAVDNLGFNPLMDESLNTDGQIVVNREDGTMVGTLIAPILSNIYRQTNSKNKTNLDELEMDCTDTKSEPIMSPDKENSQVIQELLLNDSLVSLVTAVDDDDVGCSSISTNHAMEVEVTAQLSAAGPIGVAAAAAISSVPRHNRTYSFVTDPKIRKRKDNLLQRQLKITLEEFLVKTGQQAIILVVAPGPKNTNCIVFGSKPLEDVVRDAKPMLMNNLTKALAKSTPLPVPENPYLFVLPPLVCNGIPTALEKMTQSQLRTFIPQMIKYSTGRLTPGWGIEARKPPWWPKEFPWTNIRCDNRSVAEKQSISSTDRLRHIVKNCYTYHGREDMLLSLEGEDEDEDEEAFAESPNTTQSTPPILDDLTGSPNNVSVMQVNFCTPMLVVPVGITGNSKPEIIQLMAEQGFGDFDFSSATEATLNAEGRIVVKRQDGTVICTLVEIIPSATCESPLNNQNNFDVSVSNAEYILSDLSLPQLALPEVMPYDPMIQNSETLKTVNEQVFQDVCLEYGEFFLSRAKTGT